MRKTMLRLLCCVMAMLLCCSAALAANATLMAYNEQEQDYPSLSTMAAVGDTLYYIRSIPAAERGDENTTQQAFYRFQEGMTEPERIGTVYYAGNYSNQEGLLADLPEGADADHVLWRLFSDGERLMSLNPFSGKVFTVEVQADGSLSYTDLTTVDGSCFIEGDMESDGYTYLSDMVLLAANAEQLCVISTTYDEKGTNNTLRVFDLASGSMKVSQVEHICGMSSYKNGKFLALMWDQDNAWDRETQQMKPGELGEYDAQTDTFTKLRDFTTTYTSRLCYDAQSDLTIYFEGGKLMGMKDMGEPRQVGYAPMDGLEQIVSMAGSVALFDYNGLYVRTVSESFNADTSLTVYGGWMDDGQRLFVSRHPEVPVYNTDTYYDTTEALSQALVSGENSMDVLQMSVSWQSYTTLRDKGYCADLSGYAELMSAVEKMQPCVRDLLIRDGKLYGVPVSASAWGFSVNNSVMEEMGLTMDDIPKNYVELCQFLTEWNDTYADEWPNINPFDDMTALKKTVFNRIMESYLGWCQATGQEVSFDTPVFRQMMAAYESMRVDDISISAEDANSEEYWSRETLLYTYGSLAGSFSSYGSDYQTIIPFSLTPDTDFTVGLELRVAFINPRSQNKDLAAELLQCMLESLDSDTHYTLWTDATEPVLNPHFDSIVKSNQTWLAQIQEQLATADEADKKDLQEQLGWAQKEIDRQETYRYSISTDEIAYFNETIAPALYVKLPTFLSATKDDASSELNTLIQRYTDGQIALDQFIHDADKKMRMIQMEDY